jgi:hypothetical protein
MQTLRSDHSGSVSWPEIYATRRKFDKVKENKAYLDYLAEADQEPEVEDAERLESVGFTCDSDVESEDGDAADGSSDPEHAGGIDDVAKHVMEGEDLNLSYWDQAERIEKFSGKVSLSNLEKHMYADEKARPVASIDDIRRYGGGGSQYSGQLTTSRFYDWLKFTVTCAQNNPAEDKAGC